jgi:hypothetical protein
MFLHKRLPILELFRIRLVVTVFKDLTRTLAAAPWPEHQIVNVAATIADQAAVGTFVHQLLQRIYRPFASKAQNPPLSLGKSDRHLLPFWPINNLQNPLRR